MKIIGIDLAARATNPSGFAVLSDHRINMRLIHSDEEIVEICVRERPILIAIDAPLSLPKHGNLRKADASLIERGLRVFPPTFAGMRSLTERGIRLADMLRAKGLRVIEIHPRTSGVLLFKTPDRHQWVTKLGERGVKLDEGASEHEIDAAIAALTGALYIQKKTEEVGEAEEGTIVIPRHQLL
jgi:hypothetical protein